MTWVRRHGGLIVGLLVGALITLFAVLNLDDVEVNWIFFTATTPLIVVIVASFLCGVVLAAAVLALSARRRRR